MLEIVELTTVGTHSEVAKEPIRAANQSSLVKRVRERSLPRVVIGIVFHLTQISIGIFRSASTHDGTSERKGIRHQTRDVLHRRIHRGTRRERSPGRSTARTSVQIHVHFIHRYVLAQLFT